MGGCRCSYRTCTVRSDGKTHMYHFPVFNKTRCHQWIVNAQKPNFLDLKLSQLKNRVICEHHFKEECFMNVLKERLRNDAVPTEDGPFCTSKNNEQPDEDKIYPICIYDIDNDVLCYDEKKAHFSVKYGDFLTNDVTELLTSTQDPGTLKKKDCEYSHNMNYYMNNLYTLPDSTVPKSYILDDANNKKDISIPSSKQKHKTESQKLLELSVVPIDFDKQNPEVKPEAEEGNSIQNQNMQSNNVSNNVTQASNTPKSLIQTNPNKKVKILSRQIIKGPLKIKGQLKPVLPSLIIEAPKRRNENSQNIFIVKETKKSELNNNTDTLQNNVEQQQGIVPNNDIINVSLNFANEREPNNPIIFDPYQTVVEMQNIQKQSPNQIVPENITPIQDNKPKLQSLIRAQDDKPKLQSLVRAQDSETKSQSLIGAQGNKPKSPSTPKSTALYKSPKNSVLKCPPKKLPPEKLAEIEEKRKYNMKIRDIIDNCLNNLDEPNDENVLTAVPKPELKNKQDGTFILEKPNPMTPQDKYITYLESRLQRLEDSLLKKIDQNTKGIVELKKIITKPGKKTAASQTYISEDVCKKQLFTEISKYLSPDANSLIYEELFINKYSCDPDQSQIKRRKR